MDTPRPRFGTHGVPRQVEDAPDETPEREEEAVVETPKLVVVEGPRPPVPLQTYVGPLLAPSTCETPQNVTCRTRRGSPKGGRVFSECRPSRNRRWQTVVSPSRRKEDVSLA